MHIFFIETFLIKILPTLCMYHLCSCVCYYDRKIEHSFRQICISILFFFSHQIGKIVILFISLIFVYFVTHSETSIKCQKVKSIGNFLFFANSTKWGSSKFMQIRIEKRQEKANWTDWLCACNAFYSTGDMLNFYSCFYLVMWIW